jgi:chemotaxis protein MotB
MASDNMQDSPQAAHAGGSASGELSVAFTQSSDERYRRGGRNMRRRSGEGGGEGASNAWLISFTDIMALMLTFFVLLFSMTEPSDDEWSEVTSALRSEFSKYYGAMQSHGLQEGKSIQQVMVNEALSIDYLASIVRNVIEQNDVLQTVGVIEKEDRLLISFPHDLLFGDGGGQDITLQGGQAVSFLGESLSSVRNKIEVVGYIHPDDMPDGTVPAQYYQRSAVLASQVASVLQTAGYRKDLVIRGGGIGRFIDMSYTSSGALRDAMSRRVDLEILNHDGRRSKVF